MNSLLTTKSSHLNKWRFFLLLFLAVVVVLLLWPERYRSVSPNKRWTASVTATNVFTRMIFPGLLTVKLKDNVTGKTIITERQRMGTIWDDSYPTEVIWHPDNKRFAVILMTVEMPHEIYFAYRIKGNPSPVVVDGYYFGADWADKVINSRYFSATE